MQEMIRRFIDYISPLFWLLIPLSLGIYIAGDAYSLGKYIPYSEVLLPFGGVLIFLVFFLQYFQKAKAVPLLEVVLFLLFIVIHLLLAFKAQSPMISASNLVLWVTGFLLLSCGSAFSLDTPKKQLWAWGCLLFWAIMAAFFSEIVHIQVLSLAALWVWMQSIWHYHLDRIFFCMVLMWTFFWFFHQTAFLIISLILFFTLNLWTNRSQRIFETWQWMGGLGFLMGLMISQWAWPWWDMDQFSPLFEYWYGDFGNFLFGIGDRAFYSYYATEQFITLDPTLWLFPSSDALLALFEKGIIGFLAQILLLLFPLWRKRPYAGVRSFLALLLLLTVSSVWSSGSGILLLSLILFV